jgi:glycosyltransferase involved in cell wall biosynthesis
MKILFISHDASRTGAPLSLLKIITWFSKNSDNELYTLFRSGGPEIKSFKEVSEVFMFEDINVVSSIKLTTYKLLNRMLNFSIHRKIISHKLKATLSSIIKPLDCEQNLRNILIKEKFGNIDIIFNNTITNGSIVEQLSILKIPIITRVAEMGYTMRYKFEKSFLLTKKYTNHFVAVSKKVKDDLILNGVNESSIQIIHGAIDENLIAEVLKNHKKVSLSINKNEFIVMCSGSRIYRKGFDLLAILAIMALKKDSDIKFVWLGGHNSEIDPKDLECLQSLKNVRLIESIINPHSYYQSCDVFLMLSRYDPFPIVVLEAGYMEKPIFCFENSGGTSEVVQNDGGAQVPYLDLENLLDNILFFKNNPDYLSQSGRTVANRIKQNFTIDITGPKFKQLFDQVLKTT